MRWACLVLAGCPLIAMCAAAQAPEPFLAYAARKTPVPPVLDGRLDEACWRSAEQTTPFVMIGGGPAPVETRGRLCWDAHFLYLAIVCPEPQMATLTDRLKRGLVAPMEESVEIFIDSDYDQFTYLQFRVGVQRERDTHRGNDPEDRLTFGWQAAVSRTADHWTVEAAIPFALLAARPSQGALWGLNFNRQRCLKPEGMWTCWSDTKGGFHSPARFGHLVFDGYARWLLSYFGAQVREAGDEVTKLARRYPRGASSAGDQLPALDREFADFSAAVVAARPSVGAECSALYARGQSVVAKHEEALARLRLAVIARGFE